GKLDLALPLLEETLKLRKAKLGADHLATLTSLSNLAEGYQAAGKLDLALPLYEEILKLSKTKLGAGHPDTLASMSNLAVGYQAAGKLDLALSLLQQAAAGIEKRHFPHQYADGIVGNLIICHEQLQQLDQAETWRRKWLAVVKQQAGAESLACAGQLTLLGLNLLRQQKWTEAETTLKECLAIRRKKLPDAWYTFTIQSMLGGALLGQKKYTAAEPLLLAGYKGLKARVRAITPQARARLTEAALRLVQLYEVLGRQDAAAQWRKEAERFTGKLVGPVHEVGGGVTLRGQLEAQTPALVYQVKFAAGKTYVIDLVSADPKAFDPYLSLCDVAGQELAADDDGGGGRNARLIFRAAQAGTYRLGVSAFGPGRGAFTLTVREQTK
ncbi:MAG: tetratricopeptide repeat protein, partial [Gemmataceae bacterium]|nr:tetratricopeptide repeat protein [Gemmataceae bacterium]